MKGGVVIGDAGSSGSSPRRESLDPKGSSRRRFLGRASAGLAAAWLTQLDGARRAFADEAPTASGSAAGSLAALRDAYALDSGVTYLNHASIGTIPRAVMASQVRYLELCESNPWLHMWGEAWKGPREEVRRQSAELLGCDASEVCFTHNTTEAFNVLAQGLPIGRGDEVLFSSLNHSGASVCWHHMAETRGFSVRRFDYPVAKTPSLDAAGILDIYDRAIRPETRVLVLPHVDNTVGIRHPMREIAALARSKGVEFIAVDAAQTVGMLPVNVAEMGVDVYATSAHKWLQAPKGLGVAYVRKDVQPSLRPMWVTWGQDDWGDSARQYEDYGTRNLAEVLTLGDALHFHRAFSGEEVQDHHRRLWQHARARVAESPRLSWNSPETWDLSAPLYSIGVEGEPSSRLFARLFESHGFVFRPFETLGLNAIRLSPNTNNTVEQLDRLFDVLNA